MQEMQVQSPGQEDPLEKDMTTHSSILAWEIPWAIVYRVRKNWTQLRQLSTHILIVIIVPAKVLLFCLLNMATSFKTSFRENWKLLPQPLVALSSHVTRLNCSIGQTTWRTQWVGALSPARQPTLPRPPVYEKSHVEWSRPDQPPVDTTEPSQSTQREQRVISLKLWPTRSYTIKRWMF